MCSSRDTTSWQALADAGLLALALPEELGGEGLGLAEIGTLLREVGRHAAYLPVWETLACGVLPVVGPVRRSSSSCCAASRPARCC